MNLAKLAQKHIKALAAVALLVAVVGYLNLDRLRMLYFQYSTHLEEIPLSGATISYRDMGEGSPTVVIVSGMACNKDSYYDLQKELAKHTRVIGYDRPGLGRSTMNAEPRTLDVIDRDLEKLLEKLNAPPPYILVGHSLGGHIIRYFTHNHPGQTAGMIFLDHPHEDWLPYIRKTWPAKEQEEYFPFWDGDPAKDKGSYGEERVTYEKNCDLVRGIEIPPQVPVLMFTANNHGHFRKTEPGKTEDGKMWVEYQKSLLDGVKDAKHIVDFELSHMPQRDKPDLIKKEAVAFLEHVRSRGDYQARASK